MSRRLFRGARYLAAALFVCALLFSGNSLWDIATNWWKNRTVVDSFKPRELHADEVAIDTTINTTFLRHQKSGKNAVCTSIDNCYVFYINSDSDIEYQKSSDGGVTWPGVSTQIQAGTIFASAIWYDRWTPGDTGTLVHLLYFDSNDDLTYAVFDTSNDTVLASGVVIAGAASAQGSLTNNNDVSITKATDGTLYAATVDVTAPTSPANFVHKCGSSCTNAGNWVAAGSNPWTGTGSNNRGEHDVVLLPLSDTVAHDSGDIMLVSFDVTNDLVEYNVHDASTNSWSANFTTIQSATANESTNYRHTLSGTVDPATGDLYVSFVHGLGTANTSEIRAWQYSDGWTQLTDPWPDTTDGTSIILDSDIAIDDDTGDLYVNYLRADTTATANDAYYAVSHDSGSTWSADNLLSDGTDRDHRNITSNVTGDRIFAAWMTAGILYGNTVFVPRVTVSATGTQTALLDINVPDQYVGGTFVFANTMGSTTITSITVSETGTVHAANGINNVRLYYELDTSAPQNCASESYDGTEAQFGSTVAAGFDGSDGSAQFTDSVQVSQNATLCAYVVLDLSGGGTAGETLELEITDPSQDVVVTNGEALPGSAVSIDETSTLQGGVLSQRHYHWRNDDGSETTATSATGGEEDTPITSVLKNERLRLRIGVSNKSPATTTQYRLEYGVRNTTCAAVGLWADLGNPGGAWDMSDSPNITDGAHTTDIAIGDGGITNENDTYQGTNGALKDTASQTGNITLSNTQYVDLEYAIEPLDTATFGETYCFRLTANGEELPGYADYPQATIRENSDFIVQRGSTVVTGSGATITAGVDYTAPKSAASAFIRITNTQASGAGDSAGAASQTADNTTAYISNPSNILNSITFSRFGTTGNTRVDWEIIEYIGPPGGDNEIIVRDATAVTFSTASLTATTSVSGVADDSDVVVFVTGAGNPSATLTNYPASNATANWNGGTDEVELQRNVADASGGSVISVATVEFTGINWRIQRVAHQYGSATFPAGGADEPESITPVNDLSRAFIHVQKRSTIGTVRDFGHEVWFSSVGQLTFRIEATSQAGADGQQSVAWVIENTQTTGSPMLVTRSNGGGLGGAPQTRAVDIGATVSNLSNASLFVNNRTTGNNNSMPRPVMGARLISTTQYELWMSNTGALRTYRTEVVEWPTAERVLTQGYYRFYTDNDALDPTDAWPNGGADLGENTSITSVDAPPTQGDRLRIRMTVDVSGSNLSASTTAFRLQYGQRETSCSAIASWFDVGEAASTTAAWRGFDGTPANGTALSGDPPTGGDLNLSLADRAGSYVEEGITPGNPYKVYMGESVEYDWVVEDYNAPDATTFCFRMVQYDGTPLEYDFYPTLLTAAYEVISQNWQWLDDEENETPTDTLAAENVAPINVEYDNAIKLRITAQEIAGKDGVNVKLKLQYSTDSDFSGDVFDLVEVGDCEANSIWCYADGGGADDAVVDEKVLSDSDACSSGAGSGCGTHNESGTSASTFTQDAYSAAEFEFTIRHAGALVNTVYFFRLYDVTNDAVVDANGTYPSLATEGAQLSFNISGLPAATTIDSHSTDIDTTSTEVSFGSLPLGTSISAGQRFTVSTNATHGYKIFTYQRQGLIANNGGEIQPVSATNQQPKTWSGFSGGCETSASSCYGYHSSEDVLDGASVRFAPDDTFARFGDAPEEIGYSGVPVDNKTTDIVYRVEARNMQEAGQYESSIVFIVAPVF